MSWFYRFCLLRGSISLARNESTDMVVLYIIDASTKDFVLGIDADAGFLWD